MPPPDPRAKDGPHDTVGERVHTGVDAAKHDGKGIKDQKSGDGVECCGGDECWYRWVRGISNLVGNGEEK